MTLSQIDMTRIAMALARDDADAQALIATARGIMAPGIDPDDIAVHAGWESDGRGYWYNPMTDEGKDQDMTSEDVCGDLGIDPSSFVPLNVFIVEFDVEERLRRDGQTIVDYVEAARAVGWAGPFSEPDRPDRVYWESPDGHVIHDTAENLCVEFEIDPRKVTVPARLVRDFLGHRVWVQFSDIVEVTPEPKPLPVPAP